MAGPQFGAEALIRTARQKNEAVAEIVLGKGWPYAVAAVNVTNRERREPAVLVLAKPIDQAVLTALAERAHGAVLMSDGKSAVLEGGPDSERARLRRAVGQERPGPLFEAPDGTWAAAVSQLAPSLWLWSYAGAGAAADEATASALTAQRAVWGIPPLPSRPPVFLAS